MTLTSLPVPPADFGTNGKSPFGHWPSGSFYDNRYRSVLQFWCRQQPSEDFGRAIHREELVAGNKIGRLWCDPGYGRYLPPLENEYAQMPTCLSNLRARPPHELRRLRKPVCCAKSG